MAIVLILHLVPIDGRIEVESSHCIPVAREREEQREGSEIFVWFASWRGLSFIGRIFEFQKHWRQAKSRAANLWRAVQFRRELEFLAQRFHTQTKEIFWLQFLQLQAPAALPVHRLIGHAMGERLARMLRRFCIERDACMHIKRERACRERCMQGERDAHAERWRERSTWARE